MKSYWLAGGVASAVLLTVYFSFVTFISGSRFALAQFSEFWYFILGLAAGFGVQVGLYRYLKQLVNKGSGSRGVVAVSGTTSTVAMISCCTHYLVNLIPFLGVAGFITLIAQYQIELFWIGLIVNAAGIGYIWQKIRKVKTLSVSP